MDYSLFTGQECFIEWRAGKFIKNRRWKEFNYSTFSAKGKVVGGAEGVVWVEDNKQVYRISDELILRLVVDKPKGGK